MWYMTITGFLCNTKQETPSSQSPFQWSCIPLQKAAYSSIGGKVKKVLHQMKDMGVSRKAYEIQLFADHKDMENFTGHWNCLWSTHIMINSSPLCWWEFTDHWQGKGSRMLDLTLSQCSKPTIYHQWWSSYPSASGSNKHLPGWAP